MKAKFKKLFTAVYPAIIIIILGSIVYSNSYQNSFHFDDLDDIARNPSLYDIKDIKAIWNNKDLSCYGRRFVGYYSLALNYHFHHLDVFGYHVVNNLIHFINALLVWWFMLLVFSTPAMKESFIRKDKEILSLFAGLLFLVHPIQAQTVNYIVQRLASMATMFYLLSLNLYILGRRENKEKYKAGVCFACSVLCALLGIFTKETVFTLPIVIFLFEIIFFEGNPFKKKREGHAWVLGCILLIMLLFLFLLNDVFSIFKPKVSLSQNVASISSIEYLFTQFKVIVVYIRLLFIPTGLNFDHFVPLSVGLFEPATLLSLSFLILVLSVGAIILSKYKLISFGIFWFFVTLLVESSVLPLSDVIYEHRVYLPMVGFCFVVCGIVGNLLKMRRSKIVFLCIIVVLFSVMTYQRNFVWKNEISLWSDAVRKSPRKARTWECLGSAYIFDKEYDKAKECLEKAIALDPNSYGGYSNLGNVFLELNEPDKALDNFDKAIALNQYRAAGHNNKGLVYLQKKQIDKAIDEFEIAIKHNPRFFEPKLNLAKIYRDQGKNEKAIEMYKDVYREHPHRSNVLVSMIETFLDEGNVDEAKNIAENTLIKSNDIDVILSAATVFAERRMLSSAMLLYERVMDIDPWNTVVYLELGKLYGNNGNLQEAIKIWQAGRKIFPDDERFSDLLSKAKKLMNDGVK